MKKVAYLYLILVFTLWGCQSAPPAAPEVPPAAAEPTPTASPTPEAPASAEVVDPSTVTAGNTGFSPAAQVPANTLPFSLHFGNPGRVISWTLAFVSADGTVIPVFQGEAPQLPPTLSWDGNDASGQPAPEGTYTARLSVDYGEVQGPSVAESAPFVLDVTPPSGSIEVSPQPFEPGNPDVMVDPPLVTFHLQLVAGGAPISTWRLGVIHPDGRRFFDFISEDHKDNIVKWNGRALNNASLEAGTTYDLVAQVFDRYGNVGLVKATMAVSVGAQPAVAAPPAQATPVTVSVDGTLVAETKIFFPAFSSDLTKVEPEKASQNVQALELLAQVLRTAPGTKVRVIGHANKVYWWDKAKGEREQNEVLLPLSLARAITVRDALTSLGLDAELFLVSGVGAEGAVAPFSDPMVNWMNRRVEFVVEP